ncbi:helix-turn-helix domain [Caudoviricetes sp.]|nr:helix-turn-helix domain [Caudoviricetes sp.]
MNETNIQAQIKVNKKKNDLSYLSRENPLFKRRTFDKSGRLIVHSFEDAVRNYLMHNTLKAVALILNSHKYKEINNPYLSIPRLAFECNVSRSTVFRALAELESIGFIQRIRTKRPDGGQASNRYKFKIPTCFFYAFDEGEIEIFIDDDTGGSVTHDTGGSVTHDTPNKTYNNKTLKKEKIYKKDSHEKEFQDFYNQYPNKKDPRNAFNAYIKARKKTPHEEIIKGLDAYKGYCEKEKAWYSPKMPATWLNAESWKNEYSTAEQKDSALPTSDDIKKLEEIMEQSKKAQEGKETFLNRMRELCSTELMKYNITALRLQDNAIVFQRQHKDKAWSEIESLFIREQKERLFLREKYLAKD